MANLLCIIAALAAAVSAQASADTSSLAHHKVFSFLYGSSDRDDLDVDINASASGDHDDSVESEDAKGTDALVYEPLIEEPIVAPSDVAGTKQVALEAGSVQDAPNAHDALQQILLDQGNGNTLAPQGDDVVWVTRYSYASVTVPLPSATPTTDTEYLTVTQQQTVLQTETVTQAQTITETSIASAVSPPQPETVTETSIVTATVTAPAGYTSSVSPGPETSQEAFQQGFNEGYSAGQWNCVVNATHSVPGEQIYDQGYVDGAHWAYRLGYTDGAGRRPFAPPEFASPQAPVPAVSAPALISATPTPAPPTYPATSSYVPQPTQNPYGYPGFGYGYPGYGGYGAPVPSPPPLPATPVAAPPPISYTTISYFVPYGQPAPYFGGYYPYEEEAAAPEDEVSPAEATPSDEVASTPVQAVPVPTAGADTGVLENIAAGVHTAGTGSF